MLLIFRAYAVSMLIMPRRAFCFRCRHAIFALISCFAAAADILAFAAADSFAAMPRAAMPLRFH